MPTAISGCKGYSNCGYYDNDVKEEGSAMSKELSTLFVNDNDSMIFDYWTDSSRDFFSLVYTTEVEMNHESVEGAHLLLEDILDVVYKYYNFYELEIRFKAGETNIKVWDFDSYEDTWIIMEATVNLPESLVEPVSEEEMVGRLEKNTNLLLHYLENFDISQNELYYINDRFVSLFQTKSQGTKIKINNLYDSVVLREKIDELYVGRDYEVVLFNYNDSDEE